MTFFDYIVGVSLTVVLIVGGYQFYFFPQRNFARTPRELGTWLDERIPFNPHWVWVYSGLYYPVIIFLVLTIDSFLIFAYTAFSFISLLVFQVAIFMIFPVKTPSYWRSYDSKSSKSTRFLSYVHSFDDTTNCFPSMHVSVATLTALHLFNNFEPTLYTAVGISLFPVLISLSTLFTKQHYLVDIPAGAALGYICYRLFVFYAL